MENIIVSVTDSRDNLRCDMELPPDYTTEELLPVIWELLRTLHTEETETNRFSADTRIKSYRLGRALDLKETLISAGVYSGDELQIVERPPTTHRGQRAFSLEEMKIMIENEKRGS